MFARRTKRKLSQSLRNAVWPRTGWRRAFVYFWKRILRLSSSPYAVAAGGAAGVFSAFSPFLGLHIVIALALAFVLRGNMLAAALGTTVANPLTIPLMWAASYEVGSFITGAEGGSGVAPHHEAARRAAMGGEDMLEAGLAAVWPILKPTLIGSIPLGLIAAALAFVALRGAVGGLQERRHQRRAERTAARLAEDAAMADGRAP